MRRAQQPPTRERSTALASIGQEIPVGSHAAPKCNDGGLVHGFQSSDSYGLVRKRDLSKNERLTTKAVIHRSCSATAPAVMDVAFSINCWRIPSVLAHCYYSSGGVSVLVRASSSDQRNLSGGLLVVGSRDGLLQRSGLDITPCDDLNADSSPDAGTYGEASLLSCCILPRRSRQLFWGVFGCSKAQRVYRWIRESF